MSTPSPLEQLYCLETSSSQFPTQTTSILDGVEYKLYVQTLEKSDASLLVEHLDKVLSTFDPASLVFRTCLRELRRISGTYRTLPSSYTISKSLLGVASEPIPQGFYGEVYRGSLDNSTVRVKRLSTLSKTAEQNFAKNFYEEAVAWKHLKHPNIAPLLGITVDTPSFQLISYWISGENLTEYIKKNRGADELGLISGIASGLEYLHSNNVVHGNLMGSNIIVEDIGRVQITDFGLSTMPESPVYKRGFFDDHNARWTAPEILHESGTHSKEADIFSFAMVMIEVFTGAFTFDRSQLTTAVLGIMNGDRPPRPTNQACSDGLWAMMQRCWDQKPQFRPEVSEVSEVFRALPGSTPSKLERLHMHHGMASHEFRNALVEFYCSTEDEDRIDSLNGRDGKVTVDFLDKVLRTKGLDRSLLQQTLHNLRRVCNHWEKIPSSCVISDGLSPVNQSSGVSAWKLKRLQGGVSQTDVQVNVKKPREMHNETYGQVVTWAWLDHPNVLPCFGITPDPFQVVTEWVPHGNIIKYVQTTLNVDHVCLLMDVAQGLDHLHSYGVIHQNLKSENVLVNGAGRACLSDIGFDTAHDEEFNTDDTETDVYHSRWEAPEVFENKEFSEQSDVFSFGFVAAEILTGEMLWRGISAADVRLKITEGERPRMPKGMTKLGVTAEVWGMLTKCWEAKAEERITISRVVSFLKYTPQPKSGRSYNLQSAMARSVHLPNQDFIDELDEILERNEVSDQEWTGFLNILCKMCSRQRTLPKSMHIAYRYREETGEECHGGNATVHKGEDHGRPVAVKVARIYTANDPKTSHRRFCREAVAWKHLKHPNILPLFGVNVNFETHQYAMISEWMDNGNINEFIQKNKEVNRAQLLVETAFGLEYMHGLRIVHGDLKGANILITGAGRACLADFGLTTIAPKPHQVTPNAYATSAASTSTTSLVSFTPGGTTRWMSPELLHPEKFGVKDPRPTTQSDCYALGMVVYEVLLGKPPYWEFIGPGAVLTAVIRGMRPEKPYAAEGLGFTDGVWRVIERSWVVDVDARPDVKTILHHLNHAASVWNRRQPV